MNRLVPLTFTGAWLILALTDAIFSVRHPPRSLRLHRWQRIALLVFDAALITVSPWLRRDTSIPYRYPATMGILLFLVGWVLSHDRLVAAGRRDRPRPLRYSSFANRLLGRQLPITDRTLLADCLQLAGFAFVWSSPYVAAPALLVGLLIIYVGQMLRRSTPSPERDRLPRRHLRALYLAVRVLVRPLIPAVVGTLISAWAFRDLTLFYGTCQDAVSLVGTLAQVEATVGALIVTFYFVLIEFATSTYSPRLAGLVTSRSSLTAMLILSVFSLGFKILFAANASRCLPQEDPAQSLFADLAFLSSVPSAISFVVFSRHMLRMLSPEATVSHILKDFTAKWMDVVRSEWSSERTPRSLFIQRDPMMRVERVLASQIERGDVTSFRAAVFVLAQHLDSVARPDDGPVIDAYLQYRLGDLLDRAARAQANAALEALCDYLPGLTKPAPDALHTTRLAPGGPPPGTRLLRSILEAAVTHHLPASAGRALTRLGSYADAAMRALPAAADLTLFSDDSINRTMSGEQKRTLRANDHRLSGYINGYLYYFGYIGQLAVRQKMPDIARAASTILTERVLDAVTGIRHESYQAYLVDYAFLGLNPIVTVASSDRVLHAVDLGLLPIGLLHVEYETVALKIVVHLAEFCLQLAHGGVLDSMTVMHISDSTLGLAPRFPEAVLPVLGAFGEAGQVLHKPSYPYTDQHIPPAHREILRQIDQLEAASTDSRIGGRVREAAANARRIASGSPPTLDPGSAPT